MGTEGAKTLQPQTYSCQLCPHLLPDLDSLALHDLGHTRDSLFSCDICQVTFLQKPGLDKHCTAVHNSEAGESVRPALAIKLEATRAYSCQLCSAVLPDETALAQHDLGHTKESLFSCDVCQAMFMQESGLEQHCKAVHNTKAKPRPNYAKAMLTNESEESCSNVVIMVMADETSSDPCLENIMAALSGTCEEKGVLEAHIPKRKRVADEDWPEMQKSKTLKCSFCEVVVDCDDIAGHMEEHMGGVAAEGIDAQDRNCNYTSEHLIAVLSEDVRDMEEMPGSPALTNQRSKRKCRGDVSDVKESGPLPETKRRSKRKNKAMVLDVKEDIQTPATSQRLRRKGKQNSDRLQTMEQEPDKGAQTSEQGKPVKNEVKEYSEEDKEESEKKKSSRKSNKCKCPICGVKVAPLNMTRHVEEHERRKQCPACDVAFTDEPEDDIMAHIAAHVTGSHLRCDACDVSYNTLGRLVTHLRLHMEPKPFVCSTCSKGFYVQAHLVKHRRTHVEETPFSCEECRKSFQSEPELREHAKRHEKGRVHICDVCNSSFIYKSKLVLHRMVHTGLRPFECPDCMMSFTQKGALVRHYLVHTRDNPYMCTTCKLTFRQKADLNQHLLVGHLEVNPPPT